MRRQAMRGMTAAYALTIGACIFAMDAWPQSPAGSIQGNAQAGQAQYMSYGCYACHGHTGETGDGARLNPPRFEQAAFIAYVRNPPPVSASPFRMPAYGGETVTDQVLADIYAYLASLESATPPLEDISLLNEL